MKHSIILVADSTMARIFSTDSARDPLSEIKTMEHPEGRLHDREITSDLPGSDTGGGQTAKQALEGETDPKKYLLSEFARDVADHLDQLRNTNTISNILVVAAPKMLGELRNHLSDETNKKIVFELDKNLTQESAEDIRAHLPQYLTH